MLSDDALVEIEGDAEAMIRRAGGDPDDGLTVHQLSVALLGTKPELAPLLLTEAALARVGEQWRIFVRRGVSAARARWLVGHELAEWWYEQLGYNEPDREARCDALGAALVVPRRVFLRVRRRCGDDVHEVARTLKTTQSLALLRRGECIGVPVAVVRERGAIVRGGEDFVWPAPLTLSKARRLRHPELARVRLSDEPKRVGLVAA